MTETTETGPWDLRLREPTSPLSPSHLRQPLSWIVFMREIDSEWQRYMRESDSPEQRLATKIEERFCFDP